MEVKSRKSNRQDFESRRWNVALLNRVVVVGGKKEKATVPLPSRTIDWIIHSEIELLAFALLDPSASILLCVPAAAAARDSKWEMIMA